jgi:hypothetical protein
MLLFTFGTLTGNRVISSKAPILDSPRFTTHGQGADLPYNKNMKYGAVKEYFLPMDVKVITNNLISYVSQPDLRPWNFECHEYWDGCGNKAPP